MLLALILACSGGPPDSAPASSEPTVRFTWMGVTNWLVETPESTLLLDAFFTREAGTSASHPDGIEAMERQLSAAGVGSVDHILVGHSHFDHALDVGTAAIALGAQVWGSETTCRIAQAQGLPEEQCTVLSQGSVVESIPGLVLRAARSPHWWPTVGSIGTYEILESIPEASQVGSAPNGGVLTLHLDFGQPGSVIFQNSLGPLSDDDGSEEDYRANLIWLTEETGPSDAWLGCPNCTSSAEPFLEYFDLLTPEAFVAHHWDNALGSPEAGLSSPFSATEPYREAILSSGVSEFIPRQYFESWELRDGDWMQRDTHPIQLAIGLHPDGP
jgi:hypothetical protein